MKYRRYIYYHELVDYLAEFGYSCSTVEFPLALRIERPDDAQFWRLYGIQADSEKWVFLSVYGARKLCVIGSAPELEAIIMKRLCLPEVIITRKQWDYLDKFPMVREAVVAKLLAQELEAER
jgi:hypothetical protein